MSQRSHLDRRRGELSPAKRALLESRLKGSAVDADKTLSIPRRQEGVRVPLSFAQQRLWFLDQLEPGSPVYNIPVAFRLSGPLDVDALERSLNEIIRRHEALRTTFSVVDDEPVQVIAPSLTLKLERTDLSGLSEADREAAVVQLAGEEAQRPFDLSRGPLFRVGFLKLEEAEHVLLMSMHHIVSDGWSMGVLYGELSRLYETFREGKPHDLSELPIQYGDFALWQRGWFQGEVLEKQLSYWKEQLKGVPSMLELPTDRPRPPVQTYRGGRQSFVLPKELTEGLKELSRKEGVSLFMTLLAAFQVLLYRYTGQEDMVVGCPIANRTRPEVEGLIGFFVNTLVLRSNLSGDPSFREILGRVKEVALGAYDHQDLPFEKLVEEIQPDRDMSRNPLIQVVFSFQNVPRKPSQLSGLTVLPLELHSGTTKFDLTLSIVEEKEELAGELEYNTELLDASRITRMAGHLTELLEGIVWSPYRPISQLPLLTERERHKLLVELNCDRTDYLKHKCIHELFEEQVEQTPDAVAVVFEDSRLTYQQLNRRANQLAHYLRKKGIGPEVLVGICVERSLDMVVGLLGILKAGGAYLPLDPTYPKERLAFMLVDGRLAVLLTQERLLADLPFTGATVICIDTGWETIAKESWANHDSGTTAENLAYVIYTSGSTGNPKGVLISHGNVVRLFHATQSWLHFSGNDVWSLFHSYAFDFSVWEIWGPLFYGGKLVIVPYWASRSPEAFFTILQTERVTVLNQTPSAFRQLIQTNRFLRSSKDLSLRLIIFGGEALDLQSLQPWVEHQGVHVPQLVNMYGITETTVHVTYQKLTEVNLTAGSASLIGGPIPDLQVYLLDHNMEPVPIGIPGELYVGGAGLARGYLNRPNLTAERFICNPFSDKPGARLYKTGDLARYRPDGTLEYLGRLDHQVQIRGFRIELGEIETALHQHPAAQEVVVLDRKDISGHGRLVAYIVVEQNERPPSVGDFRSFLKDKLPEYMIPSTFVYLPVISLTPSGKVDRLSLPDPDAVQPKLEGTFVAPRTTTEKILTDIWTEVLRISKVGVFNNFFELGGDSILALQIISRAHRAGFRLTPKQMFQHPTIAELAMIVETVPVVERDQGSITGPVPLTPIQRWFFEQPLPEPHHWNQSMLLEVCEPLDLSMLEAALNRLLIHHDILRLRFVSSKNGWQQVISEPGEDAPFVLVDLSTLSEIEQKKAIETRASELQASLDLSAGPILMAAFFDLGPARSSRLLLVIHHLAIDSVSWRILLEDLQAAYRYFSRGEAIKLPPKTTSFQYWARRLTEFAQSDALRQEVFHWLAEQRKHVSPLPKDYEGRTNMESSARVVTVSFSPEETHTLLKEIHEPYQTQINDVLLTALIQAFSNWTEKRSVLIDLEGHGREDIFDEVDLSRTVGWFTSIFPVLLDLGEASNPGDALMSIKEQLRRIPNKGIGYGLLRYLSGNVEIADKLHTLPQAEVSFNYLGQFDQVFLAPSPFRPARESSGLEHSPLGTRPHLLSVEGKVVEGKLHMVWRYSADIHRRSTIERLATDYMEVLLTLIRHCKSPEAGGYTASDFPEAKLSQKDLDELIAQLDEFREENCDGQEEY